MDLYSGAKQWQALIVSSLPEVFLLLLIFYSNPVGVFWISVEQINNENSEFHWITVILLWSFSASKHFSAYAASEKFWFSIFEINLEVTYIKHNV